jgi:hypothetical protein
MPTGDGAVSRTALRRRPGPGPRRPRDDAFEIGREPGIEAAQAFEILACTPISGRRVGHVDTKKITTMASSPLPPPQQRGRSGVA